MGSEALKTSLGELPKSVRNVPVQARADIMLNSLLDAAAYLIDRSGYERLNTQEVANRVGCSIGTVYRYFPDRVAVLQRLALRNLECFDSDCIQVVNASTHNARRDAVRAVFQQYAAAFLSQPGFRSLRFGDVLDLQPGEGSNGIATTASRLATQLDTVYGDSTYEGTADASLAITPLAARLEIALTTFDALLVRGFALDHSGDPARMRDAHEAMREYSFV